MRDPRTYTTCRICRQSLEWDEAIAARRVRPSWKRGFVHVSCYETHLAEQSRLRAERPGRSHGKARAHDDAIDALLEVLDL